MDNNEAILQLKKLKELHCLNPYAIDIIDVHALDTAIKSLENKPLFLAKTNGTIETVNKNDCDTCVYKDYFEDDAGVMGQWLDNEVAFYLVCSVCKTAIHNNISKLFLDQGALNYCCNCGAKMKIKHVQ